MSGALEGCSLKGEVCSKQLCDLFLQVSEWHEVTKGTLHLSDVAAVKDGYQEWTMTGGTTKTEYWGKNLWVAKTRRVQTVA